ncbi:MAG: hypothetical protein HYY13_12740 [Nitrospirae bacterium]|nr:hypothetical protein [Nitrospirota bacterium]
MPDFADPILLVIVLDFILLLLCLVILFDRRRAKAPKEWAEVPEAFDRLIQEAEEFLQRAHTDMQEKRGSIERLLQEIQTQTRALAEKLVEARQVMKQMGGGVSAPEPPAPQPAPRAAAASNGGQDPYEQALRLHEEGVKIPEIAHRLSLPRSELEIVLGLRQRSQAAPKAGK